MAPVLNIRSLSFGYDHLHPHVVDNFSLTVDEREFVAILGGSGVGKSTILRCVADLIKPLDGDITFHGERRPGTRQKAVVFQDGRLMPWRTVYENVAFGLEGLGLSSQEKKSRIGDVLELTKLQSFWKRYPHQLSGGQAQRVGIARALALRPNLLLMDEPFSSVDAITRENLQAELINIWQKTKAAVLFVTHDISEAVFLADRIIVLKGRPAEIACNRRIELERPRVRGHKDINRLITEISKFI